MVLLSFGDALMITLGLTFICAIIVIPGFFLLMKVTGGKGGLHKATQDYGPNDFRTLGMLEYCVQNILENEGILYQDLHVCHEVGNRYVCYFSDYEYRQHQMTVLSDGWNVSYSIDGGIFKHYK